MSPILEGSRHVWWHRAGLTLLLSGGTMITLVGFLGDARDAMAFTIWMITGLMVASTGFLLLTMLVRCPGCGMRLFWYGLTKVPRARGVAWYLGLRQCPECGYGGSGEEAPRPERDRW